MNNITYKYLLKDVYSGNELEVYEYNDDLKLVKGESINYEGARYIIRNIERIMDFDLNQAHHIVFIDKHIQPKSR